MIDGIIYLIGAAIAMVGLLGILALATAWATDQVLKLTKAQSLAGTRSEGDSGMKLAFEWIAPSCLSQDWPAQS